MKKNKMLVQALLASSALVNTMPSVAQEGASDEDILFEEILVTATKRATSVQDVPYNISAISGRDMEGLGINDIGALSNFVPGLNFIDLGARGNLLSSTINIRGLNAEATSNFSNPQASVAPVSTYLDETPIFANLRLVDIERVEVLRGPQGTLYGSGSLGGTVRFIQNKPKLGVVEGWASGGVGWTKGAGNPDYVFDGVVNVPVTETLAIRASAGYERGAGFIDYPNLYVLGDDRAPLLAEPTESFGSLAQQTSLDDANEETSWNVRLAAYWELSDKVNALATYHHQSDSADALTATTPVAFGDDRLANNSFALSPFDSDVDLFSLDLEVDLGFATLASSTSYSKVDASGESDVTGGYLNFGFYEGTYGATPRDLILSDSSLEDKSFVQEVRLVSQHEGPLQYVLGFFHRNQDYVGRAEDNFPGHTEFFAACAASVGFDPLDPTYDPFSGLFPDAAFDCGTGAPFGVPGLETVSGVPVVRDLAYINNFDQNFKDTAIFGELTYQVTDGWQITGGVRAFWQDFENTQSNGAFYTARTLLSLGIDPDLAVRSISASTDISDVIFKLNTSFDIGENHKLYATWSEGFRRGGANGLPPVIFDFDAFDVIEVNTALFDYAPDKVTNYEAGFKGRFGGLAYNASVFWIDWSNFQINELVTSNALGAVVNGGEAESKGFELEINGNISDQLSIMASYTYTNSEVTDYSDLLVSEVLFGDDPGDANVQMPGTPEHSASWAAIYTTPISEYADLSFDLSGNYTSEVTTSIYPGASRAIDGYAFFNLGATYSTDTWDLRLSVDNVFNKLAVFSTEGVRENSDVGNSLANFFISRPRSIALNLTYRFGD